MDLSHHIFTVHLVQIGSDIASAKAYKKSTSVIRQLSINNPYPKVGQICMAGEINFALLKDLKNAALYTNIHFLFNI